MDTDQTKDATQEQRVAAEAARQAEESSRQAAEAQSRAAETTPVMGGTREYSDDYVEVWEILWFPEEDVKEQVMDMELRMGSVTREYSDEYPEGTVMKQKPKPGSRVKKGVKMNVVISKGPEPTEPETEEMTSEAEVEMSETETDEVETAEVKTNETETNESEG